MVTHSSDMSQISATSIPGTKLMILAVSCASATSQTLPQTVSAWLDQSLIERIRHLSQEVMRLDVLSIQMEFPSSIWSVLPIDEVSDLEDPFSVLNKNKTFTVSPTIQIFQDGFHFASYSGLSSSYVRLHELEDNEMLIIGDLSD